MFCTNCGETLADTARFCGQCGAQVHSKAGAVFPVEIKLETGTHNTSLNQTPIDASGSAPIYVLPTKDYEHPSMQKMNQLLRGSILLRKTAESISKKIGKPWYESTFNSILATEKRYPRVYQLACMAAQRLGIRQTPSVYVELDRGYQSSTFGSEQDSFVNIGSYLPRFLNDRELLFILGHEIGHLACHHALWTTVSMFLVGQQRSNLMAEGVMGYLSNPLKLIEGGVESIITNWMRVADFTADRAALLAVGSFETAKQAIFLLHLKSRKELDEMDIDEWISQAESQDLTMSKLSQMMTSATPYLGLRLIELRKFAQSPEYETLRRKVETGCGFSLDGIFDENGYMKKPRPPAEHKPSIAPPRPPNISNPAGTSTAPPPARKVRMLNGSCPRCRSPFTFRLIAVPDKPWLDIRCKACGRMFRLNLDAVRKQVAKA
jgi:Zn-dependent protease with chaperone function